MIIIILFSLAILALCSGYGIYFLVSKKQITTTCLLISTGITASLITFFSLTLYITLIWLIIIPIVTLFLTFILESDLKGLKKLLMSFIFILVTLTIFSIFFVNVFISTNYIHIVHVSYEISLENKQFKINHTSQDLPNCVKEFLKEQAILMIQNDAIEKSGTVDVAYICRYPLLFNTHDKICSCTETAICHICKKNVWYEMILKE